MKSLKSKPITITHYTFVFLSLFVIESNAQNKSATNEVIDTIEKQEQVYIGYGTLRKNEITSAISYVNSKQIAERKATNWADAIQGAVSGVQIANESGRPGATSSIITRGIGSFLSNLTPLYVVDGAINANPDGINPADIESVQVMKDASAAGIFGINSTNGVIVITTKKGSLSRPILNCNVLTSFGTLDKKLPAASVNDYKKYIQKLYGRLPDSAFPNNANNDYQDLFTQTAVRNQVDLSIRGGSNKLNYYAGFGYLKEKGIILNTWSNSIRGKLNLDYSPFKKLTVGVRILLSSRNENKLDDSKIIPILIQRSPMNSLYNPDGSLLLATNGLGATDNPMARLLLEKHTNDIKQTSLYGYASYAFLPYLRFTIDAHSSEDHTDNINLTPSSISTYQYDITNKVYTRNKYSIIQAYLSFDKTIAPKHKIYALIGTNKEIDTTTYDNRTWIYSSDFPSYYIYDTWYKSTSLLGRVGYSFSERYMLNASLNRLGYKGNNPNPKWYYYESYSLGWHFSKERFMGWSKNFLEEGKVRLSYGTTSHSKFSSNNDNGGFFYTTISPEVRSQLNLGLDVELLKGKLNISVDVYSKKNRNAFYQNRLYTNNGFINIATNNGTITNTGIELQIEAIPVKVKNFSWNIEMNLSFNKNRVDGLNQNISLTPGNMWEIANGGSIGDLVGYKALGVYQYDASNAYSSSWQLLTTTVHNSDTSYSLNGQPYSGAVNKITSFGGVTSKGGDMIWQNIN